MVISDTKRCRNCLIKGKFPDGSWGCSRSHEHINPDIDFCSKAVSDGSKCDKCGGIILKGQEAFLVSADDEGYYIYCTNCYHRLGY